MWQLDPRFHTPGYVERRLKELAEEKEHKEEASISAPFTAAQIVRIREIVQEELAKYEKRKLHEDRFGKPYPPKEAK